MKKVLLGLFLLVLSVSQVSLALSAPANLGDCVYKDFSFILNELKITQKFEGYVDSLKTEMPLLSEDIRTLGSRADFCVAQKALKSISSGFEETVFDEEPTVEFAVNPAFVVDPFHPGTIYLSLTRLNQLSTLDKVRKLVQLSVYSLFQYKVIGENSKPVTRLLSVIDRHYCQHHQKGCDEGWDSGVPYTEDEIFQLLKSYPQMRDRWGTPAFWKLVTLPLGPKVASKATEHVNQILPSLYVGESDSKLFHNFYNLAQKYWAMNSRPTLSWVIFSDPPYTVFEWSGLKFGKFTSQLLRVRECELSCEAVSAYRYVDDHFTPAFSSAFECNLKKGDQVVYSFKTKPAPERPKELYYRDREMFKPLVSRLGDRIVVHLLNHCGR